MSQTYQHINTACHYYSIINSSVHSSIGTSPASLLFENQLNLDRGILTKFPPASTKPIKSSKIIADMLLIQEQLNTNAINLLQESHKNHISVNINPSTVFEDNTNVLAIGPREPATRLHTKWDGPFKVVRHNKTQYTIMNLITKKPRKIHVS